MSIMKDNYFLHTGEEEASIWPMGMTILHKHFDPTEPLNQSELSFDSLDQSDFSSLLDNQSDPLWDLTFINL